MCIHYTTTVNGDVKQTPTHVAGSDDTGTLVNVAQKHFLKVFLLQEEEPQPLHRQAGGSVSERKEHTSDSEQHTHG